ncbi:MAG: amidophosphoribosyltransferase [archaeon]
MFTESCGLFGVYGQLHPSLDNAVLVYYGLHALQHRGQEGVGIATADYHDVYCRKHPGMVSKAFSEEDFQHLHGNIALGHVRYSTTGESRLENVQPLLVDSRYGKFAIAHNGNISNARSLRATLQEQGAIFQSTTDTEVISHLIAKSAVGNLEGAIVDGLRQLHGSYCLLIMTKEKLYVARDPLGNRPLSLGRAGDAVVVSSESCAFDYLESLFPIKIQERRGMQSGDLLVIDQEGMHSQLISPKKSAHCIFELIYFSSPQSKTFNVPVAQFRQKLGERLALQDLATYGKTFADVVMPVPDSGKYAAQGYAKMSGLPYEEGIFRRHYGGVGRTFIDPSADVRATKVREKLIPVHGMLADRRVVIIDDSIVRGTTSKDLVQFVREQGAKEIHFRVSCPPHKFPCFFGINFPTKKELIFNQLGSEDKIREYIGADTLAYLPWSELDKLAHEWANGGMCYACFDGNYPDVVEEGQ